MQFGYLSHAGKRANALFTAYGNTPTSSEDSVLLASNTLIGSASSQTMTETVLARLRLNAK